MSALRASRAETVLTIAGVAGAVRCWCARRALATIVLSVLLLFEAFVYSNAPWASLAAEGIILTPERRAYARSPQNTGERPERRRPLALPLGLTGLAAAAVAWRWSRLVAEPERAVRRSPGGPAAHRQRGSEPQGGTAPERDPVAVEQRHAKPAGHAISVAEPLILADGITDRLPDRGADGHSERDRLTRRRAVDPPRVRNPTSRGTGSTAGPRATGAAPPR